MPLRRDRLTIYNKDGSTRFDSSMTRRASGWFNTDPSIDVMRLQSLRRELGQTGTGIVPGPLRGYGILSESQMQHNSVKSMAFDGVKRAEIALKKLDADLAKTKALLRKAEIEETALANKVRGTRAAQRLRSRGGTNMRLGPMSITKSGIRLQTGGLRGFGNQVFVAGMATNIVGGLFNQGADIGDQVAELKAKGATNGEMARAAAGGAARAGVSMFGIDNLGKGMLRLAGMSEKSAGKMMDERMDRMFLTEEELERKRKAKAQALTDARREIEKVIAEDMQQISRYEPKTFRVRSSVDVHRYHSEMKSVNREREELKRQVMFNDAKRKINGN